MFRVYFSDDGDKTVCRTVVDVECMIRILTRYTDYATLCGTRGSILVYGVRR